MGLPSASANVRMRSRSGKRILLNITGVPLTNSGKTMEVVDVLSPYQYIEHVAGAVPTINANMIVNLSDPYNYAMFKLISGSSYDCSTTTNGVAVVRPSNIALPRTLVTGDVLRVISDGLHISASLNGVVFTGGGIFVNGTPGTKIAYNPTTSPNVPPANSNAPASVNYGTLSWVVVKRTYPVAARCRASCWGSRCRSLAAAVLCPV